MSSSFALSPDHFFDAAFEIVFRYPVQRAFRLGIFEQKVGRNLLEKTVQSDPAVQQSTYEIDEHRRSPKPGRGTRLKVLPSDAAIALKRSNQPF